MTLHLRHLLLLAGATALAWLFPMRTAAQSTDGYHAILVIPVVVDSASFTQRFNFQNPNGADLTIEPRYYPGGGTQVTALTCPTFTIPANGERVMTSLRAVCPALAAGTQFGFVYLRQSTGAGYFAWSAFSRVSNPQGQGFTVEGFPASTFSSATSVVTGIRRLAAGAGAPAFQTNCFLANMPVFDVPPVTTPVHYVIRNSAAAQIGSGDVMLPPGTMVRLLDVFAAGGVPAGDQNDAMITFEENGTSEPALMTFCTVQDNTSFGADFRIAKGATSALPLFVNPNAAIGPKDMFVARDIVMDTDALGRPFAIPAGAFNNLHVITFHQPDIGQCEIINPNTAQVALPSYGLEIRATDGQGGTGAGGDNSVVVPDPGKGDVLYFGDKDDSEANGITLLQVESNGQNTAANRPYKLRCRSGSGFSMPHIVRYQQAGVEF